MYLSATKRATAHESGHTLNYEGVGLRQRRRTQDVAQTNALLKQLNTTTRSGSGDILDKRMDPSSFRLRRQDPLKVSTCLHPSATSGRQQPTGGPAGARILRASSDSIHSNTLLSALIATRIHDPTPAKTPTPAKGSNWADD